MSEDVVVELVGLVLHTRRGGLGIRPRIRDESGRDLNSDKTRYLVLLTSTSRVMMTYELCDGLISLYYLILNRMLRGGFPIHLLKLEIHFPNSTED